MTTNWEQKIKEKATSFGEMLKKKLAEFNNRSLWNKLFLMACIHYVLRVAMGGKSEETPTNPKA